MITETLFNAENITANSAQLDQLKQLFPHCFDTSGHFLLEKFQATIAEQTDINREFYAMNWLGKSYAKLLRNLPPETLLAEDTTHNTKPENSDSQNLLIQGDNLEVLKHLKNAYANEIKMIYIDPPYNTGSDGFVYQDNRKFSPEQLASLASISLDEAERILNFTDKGSNSHSAWLTFMYPRLYIARELLKDDGVIFISIDDNEQAQLKLLCDEVFGEENFIAEIVRNTNSSKNQSLFISVSHEYCFVYSKNLRVLNTLHSENKWGIEKNNLKEYINSLNTLKKKGLTNEEITNELKELTKYPRFIDFSNYWYLDERGLYRKDNLGGVKNGNITPLFNPLTNKFDPIPPGGYRYNSEKLKLLVEENRVHFHTDGSLPTIKRYLHENKKQRPKSIMSDDQRPDYKILKEMNIPFDNPKQLEFMKRIIGIFDKESLILDFFAGSGTTAHAVMQLNAEDGGNRQFILVQIPEKTDEKSEAYKAGYQTIFDITKARIEKSAVRIRQDFPNASGDFGFKIYQLTENFCAIADTDFSLESPELPLFTQLNNPQRLTLLTTWALADGAKLTASISNIILDNYTAHLCEKRLYLLNQGFSSANLLALIQKLDNDPDFNPNRVILLGSAIESHIQKELDQALATYTNRKNININLIVRN